MFFFQNQHQYEEEFKKTSLIQTNILCRIIKNRKLSEPLCHSVSFRLLWFNYDKRIPLIYISTMLLRTHYLMYFSMNFLWNSDLKLSLIKVLSFFLSSPEAQFLKTTSSSHLKLTKTNLWNTAEQNTDLSHIANINQRKPNMFFTRFLQHTAKGLHFIITVKGRSNIRK